MTEPRSSLDQGQGPCVYHMTVACDASPVGLEVVLSHIMPDGEERPIQFASNSLMIAKQQYSQIERQGLGIFFGVKRFYPFLFGRKFTHG